MSKSNSCNGVGLAASDGAFDHALDDGAFDDDALDDGPFDNDAFDLGATFGNGTFNDGATFDVGTALEDGAFDFDNGPFEDCPFDDGATFDDATFNDGAILEDGAFDERALDVAVFLILKGKDATVEAPTVAAATVVTPWGNSGSQPLHTKSSSLNCNMGSQMM
jgi:hypothetical protein